VQMPCDLCLLICLTVLLVGCTEDAGAFQAVTANFSFLYSAAELAVTTSEVTMHLQALGSWASAGGAPLHSCACSHPSLHSSRCD
jgi:hypothetical protein